MLQSAHVFMLRQKIKSFDEMSDLPGVTNPVFCEVEAHAIASEAGEPNGASRSGEHLMQENTSRQRENGHESLKTVHSQQISAGIGTELQNNHSLTSNGAVANTHRGEEDVVTRSPRHECHLKLDDATKSAEIVAKFEAKVASPETGKHANGDQMITETRKMDINQDTRIIKFGTHEGGEECPCEDCFRKREIGKKKAEELETVLPQLDEVDAPQNEPPPAAPTLPPEPPSDPTSPPSPPPTLDPTPAPIPPPTVVPLLYSAPPPPPSPSPPPPPSPETPPSEDTHISIDEEPDVEVEEPQQEVTKEERETVGKIVQDLFDELVDDEKTGGCCRVCCRGCSNLWWKACCGQALSISCTNRDFKNCNSVQKSKEVITEALENAIERGTTALKRIVFPLCSSILRDVWVSAEFILIWVAFILSLVQLTVSGNTAVLNILHLALASLALVLANIDAGFQLSEFRSCKTCYSVCKGKNRKDEKRLAVDHGDQTESKYVCCNRCCDRSTTGGKAVLMSRDAFDVVRVFLSELILYPLTICDIFELILCKGWERENTSDELSLALFIISSFSLIFFVYILRIVLLFFTLVNTQRTRQKLVDKSQKEWQNRDPPPPYSFTTTQAPPVNEEVVDRAAGKWFSGYFFVHVLSQMIAQILMIIAISAKFLYENRNYDLDQTIHISTYLWYMLAAGYMLPLCGLATFFIVNFYWVREFPIKLYIQILSVLSCPDATALFFPKEALMGDEKNGESENSEGLVHKWREVMQRVNSVDLRNPNSRDTVINDFKEMAKQNIFTDRLGFPFRSPGLVILCMIYAALQLAFIISATKNNVDGDTILAGGNWTTFYIFAIIVGGLANVYTFCVAYFWLLVIAVITAGILIAVAMICLCLLLASTASGSSSNSQQTNQRRY